MYSFEWDKKTRGYKLTTKTGKFVAAELRPVFAEELLLLGFNEHFTFNPKETAPLMWAKNNVFIYNGDEVAKLNRTQLGRELEIDYLSEKLSLLPVDIDGMISKNREIMDSLVSNTLKRIKEMYEQYKASSDIVYIAFSGGKDSVLLLDLCNRVLPMSVPIVFSDTTMELPDSYLIWERMQTLYPERKFLKFSSATPALDNWKVFGPPSRALDWCCSVHKSSPAILALKDYLNIPAVRTLAFLGIRSEESLKRNSYESDIGEGVKNASQVNAMPIESWGSHELYLYYFDRNLPLHGAYRKGVPRVGCIMCPKASDKYAWYVDRAYPHLLDKYRETIIETSLKNFNSEAEQNEYIASSGWQARKNGLEIKDHILSPSETIKGDRIEWKNVCANLQSFREWIKTFGVITQEENDSLTLRCDRADQKDCAYHIYLETEESAIINISCELIYTNLTQKKKLCSQLRACIKKAIACVGCRVCEAECSFGALKISQSEVFVDSSKCTHCLKCHSLDQGCWRYKTMMVPTNSNTPLKSIANYQNFGLRENWIQIYCEEKKEFVNTTALGKPMIESARLWFKQALLTSDSRSLEPSKLISLVEISGADNPMLWDLLWIALCNNSPLIKWFATNIPFDSFVSMDEMTTRLGDLSASTKRGGLQALNNFFKSSPIGVGSNPLVELSFKGSRVLGVKRIAKSVDPLSVLYSLYLMASVSERTSFTLSEMMNGDFESPYVSPLIAFGMSVDELKGQCLGISTIYPNYLLCNFTLGLDEVKIFPSTKSLDDIIGLIIGE